jgi:hypothetical protein
MTKNKRAAKAVLEENYSLALALFNKNIQVRKQYLDKLAAGSLTSSEDIAILCGAIQNVLTCKVDLLALLKQKFDSGFMNSHHFGKTQAQTEASAKIDLSSELQESLLTVMGQFKRSQAALREDDCVLIDGATAEDDGYVVVSAP